MSYGTDNSPTPFARSAPTRCEKPLVKIGESSRTTRLPLGEGSQLAQSHCGTTLSRYCCAQSEKAGRTEAELASKLGSISRRRPPGERAERVDLVERSANETLRPAVPTAHATNALIVTAITAARSMRAYTPRTFTKLNGAAPCRPPTASTVN